MLKTETIKCKISEGIVFHSLSCFFLFIIGQKGNILCLRATILILTNVYFSDNVPNIYLN